MDTNTVALLLQIAGQRSGASDNTMIVVVGMIITALTTITGTIIGYLNTRDAKLSSEATHKIATDSVQVLDTIHTAVNSGAEKLREDGLAMRNEISALKGEILTISKSSAILSEQRRVSDIKDATVATVVVPLTPASKAVPGNLSPDQFRELVEALKK